MIYHNIWNCWTGYTI